jgi:uncharacterized protein YuzE
MRLTYDPRLNVAYLHLRDDRVEVETIRISEELFIDVAADGSVHGIEFLNANEQLRGADGGKLVVVDDSTGTRHDIPLAAAE